MISAIGIGPEVTCLLVQSNAIVFITGRKELNL